MRGVMWPRQSTWLGHSEDAHQLGKGSSDHRRGTGSVGLHDAQEGSYCCEWGLYTLKTINIAKARAVTAGEKCQLAYTMPKKVRTAAKYEGERRNIAHDDKEE